MSPKPTILWVHGSWHSPEHFQPVMDVFAAAGFNSVCPLQPSIGKLPPVGLTDDAQCIRDELERLVETDGLDVVVVAHSYGGMVANQGVDARFAKARRAKEGRPGGVVRVVFMAAFVVGAGDGLSTPFGGEIPPFIPVDDKGMCMMADPANKFYHDLPEDEQKRWVSLLKKTPASTQVQPITQTVYGTHPVSYIYFTEDQALIFPVQQKLVRDVSDKFGIEIPTEEVKGSHSAYLSMPDKVLAAIQRQI